MEIPDPTLPTSGQIFSAWWDLTQVFKGHVTPVLEREHGIDFKDFMALNMIQRGARYPGQLCERMSIKPSGASRIIDDLVKNGFLERQLDPQDSRRVRLILTERGEAALDSARTTMITLMDRGLSGLSAEQVQHFVAVVQHLAVNLDGPAPLNPPAQEPA